MAISRVLRRLGFVKLDEYGLILTADARVLSTRPAVLDDGLGGKIVGWREGDLAAMELAHWQSAPATRTATANRSAGVRTPTMPPIPVRPTGAQATVRPPRVTGAQPTVPPHAYAVVQTFAPVVAAPAVAAPATKRAPTPLPLETQPMIKIEAAPPLPLEEDEWEWEIAVARARAAAEWAEEAAQVVRHAAAPVELPKHPYQRSKRPTTPIAIVAEKRAEKRAKTEPIVANDPWETSTATARTVRVLPRVASPTPPRPIVVVAAPAVRTTVIPVPAMTQVSDPRTITPPARPTALRPSAAVMSPSPMRRYPRGTGPTEQPSEDTLVTSAAAPANDDLTSPGIALPQASVSKRVAAKQR